MQQQKWIALPLAIIMAGCGMLPFGGGPAPADTPKPQRQQPAVPVTVAPVGRADLAARLEYAGNVVAKAKVNLVPKISGRIDRLTVDVGTPVRAGQVIAELDSATLEAQVQQARAGVTVAEAGVVVAEAKLDLVNVGSRPEEVAVVRAQLAEAQARFDQVQAGATADVVAAAEASVQQAQSTLRNAEVKLDDLRKGADSVTIRTAQAAVEAARANVRGSETKVVASETKVTALREFQLASDLVSAETSVVAAEARLKAAEFKVLDLKEHPKPEEIRIAEADVQKAHAAVLDAEVTLEDVKSRPKPIDVAIQESVVAQTRAAFEAAVSVADGSREANAALGRAGVPGYTAGQAESNAEAARAAWEKAQSDLQKLKDGSTVREIQTAASALETQRASLAAAEAKLKQVKDGPSASDIQAAQTTVDTARTDLRVAQQRLDDLRRGARDIDLQAAQAAVQDAQSAVEAARANVASNEARLDQVQTLDLVAAETTVEAARATLLGAQAKLDFLREGPQTWDVTAARAKVDQSRQQLALREQPYRPEDIRSAESEVTRSRAAVEQSRAALRTTEVQRDEAMLRAPFDGVVIERFLAAGALASPSTPVVALIASDVEVVVNVEETNLGQIQVGRPARLTSVAYPGVEFQGQVSIVSPAADTRNRTFAVRIAVPREETRLRDGMFVQATIVGEERANAIVVPRDAIVQRGGKTGAFVVRDGTARFTEVQTGLASSQQIEVREGLTEGLQVIVAGHASLNDGDRVAVPASGQRQPPKGG